MGAAFADALGGRLLDGDDYHPQSSIDHMASGQPLTDEMHLPWLANLADAVNETRQEFDADFACSALRTSYRDFLLQKVPDLNIVFLDAPQDLLPSRLGGRSNHFMSSSLLDSQLATLERPQQPFATTFIDQPMSAMIDELLGRL